MALQRKIAYIDLHTKKIEVAAIPETWRRSYLGGQGLAAFLLHQHAPSGCDPLSPDNVIIISAGILGGTVGSPPAQTYVTTKSPLTGSFFSTSVAGPFASELRWAGFDHLVISGRAKRPVYLFVEDGSIRINNASGLRGLGTYETQSTIRSWLNDEEIQILTIGSAGEKCVRFAHVLSSLRTTSDRPGAGAVFGSKNMKAVACRGSIDIEIKCPDEAIICGRRIIKEMQRMTIDRKKNSQTIDTAPLPYRELANDYGIDLETTVNLIDWIQTLYANGGLGAKQVKRLLPDSGTADRIPHGIQCIAGRKGFCDILAEGPVKAAESIGGNSLQYYKNGKGKPCENNDLQIALKTGAKKTGADIIRQLYTDRALGCLGVPPQYSWLLQPNQSVHEDFIQLIQLNTGAPVSYRKLKDVAKRCFTIERLYNLREGITPDTGEIGKALYQCGDWDKHGVPTNRLLEKLKISELRQPKPVTGSRA